MAGGPGGRLFSVGVMVPPPAPPPPLTGGGGRDGQGGAVRSGRLGSAGFSACVLCRCCVSEGSNPLASAGNFGRAGGPRWSLGFDGRSVLPLPAASCFLFFPLEKWTRLKRKGGVNAPLFLFHRIQNEKDNS